LLEGKNVNLRIMERDDVGFVAESSDRIDSSEYDPTSHKYQGPKG
jgi:hypothetical protein